MTIEIHAPNLQIKESVLETIKKKVLVLSRLGENIPRVEIFFTEHPEMPGQTKSCKIRLNIFGDTLFVHKHGDSFENAATAAIMALKKNLKKRLDKRNQLPDEVISTVKV